MNSMTEYTIFTLIGFSIILLFVSFFRKDRVKEIEEQLDQLTLSTMQEIYQIKKRLKALEEELLMSEEDWIKPTHTYSKQEKIFLLYKQGLSNEQIARQIGLPIEEVNMIIQRMMARNEK
ncbi:DUF6115 domain-containing protein [Thermolongibacillus altinsuensis]